LSEVSFAITLNHARLADSAVADDHNLQKNKIKKGEAVSGKGDGSFRFSSIIDV